MVETANRPVFIVGSPRSGTSILTWCLGQHPNMFPVPESNWMADFAVHLAISHQVGTARGDRTILSAMEISRDQLFAQFGHSINELILNHRTDLNRKRKMTRPSADPKARWVDGTPEYSLHIYGLRKLFPEAVFIHILRDVREVVRSMLNFHRLTGTALVANEEEAYKYWLRMTAACAQAESAYGPKVMYRVQYSGLIDNPEQTMRALLDFAGEHYVAECLDPLAQRINSSNVPKDFVADDPATDPAIVDQAIKLCTELQKTPQPGEPSPATADAMEADFQQRVQYAADLDKSYRDCRRKLKKLEKRAP